MPPLSHLSIEKSNGVDAPSGARGTLLKRRCNINARAEIIRSWRSYVCPERSRSTTLVLIHSLALALGLARSKLLAGLVRVVLLAVWGELDS